MKNPGFMQTKYENNLKLESYFINGRIYKHYNCNQNYEFTIQKLLNLEIIRKLFLIILISK